MIRIVSWNIELGRNVEQAAEEIVASDKLQTPDVLLVQEMSPDAAAHLAELLDMNLRYAAPAKHPKTGVLFGNAVLSPWPMSESIETPLPHTARVMGQKRAVTSAIVEVAGTQVVAHSVHLETVLLDIRRRVEQVRVVANSASVRSHPCIVAGDFNAASSRSLRSFDRPLQTAGFERITTESMKSFRRFGREFALDHAYVRDLRVRSAGVETAATASDHHPIWAELELVPGASAY